MSLTEKFIADLSRRMAKAFRDAIVYGHGMVTLTEFEEQMNEESTVDPCCVCGGLGEFGYDGPPRNYCARHEPNMMGKPLDKQEIDALNMQYNDQMMKAIRDAAVYGSGVMKLDCDDDGPESYDELLDALSGWDNYDDDNDDRRTAFQAGDHVLADMLAEYDALSSRIGEHARAMQAARKPQVVRRTGPGVYEQAQSRPGVMIRADVNAPLYEDENFTGRTFTIKEVPPGTRFFNCNLTDAILPGCENVIVDHCEVTNLTIGDMHIAQRDPTFTSLGVPEKHDYLQTIKDHIRYNVDVPEGVELTYRRGEGDYYEVRAQSSYDYGVVEISQKALSEATDPSAFWSARILEVRRIIDVVSFSSEQHIAPSTSERTCTTCSKTCDVGVKCWWCGNA